MSIIVVNLQDNRVVFRIFIALLKFSLDFPSNIYVLRVGLKSNSDYIPTQY